MADVNDCIQWGLYQKVCDKLKERKNLQTLSEAFGGLRSDAARVQFVLELGVIDEIIDIKPCYKLKSSKNSNDFRIDGNKLFKNKQFWKSLEKYNQSVLTAPAGDARATSFAHANRSAVLFHLEEYELCLKDIQTSLDSNYPKEMMYKLLDRRARCYKILGRSEEAIKACSEALECVEVSDLKDTDKISRRNDLEKYLMQCSEKSMVSIGTKDNPVPPELTSFNDKYIATSKAFDIATSPSKGRYPVAALDIDLGEVLVVEKPFASVLLEECQSTHCHHCFQRTLAPIPCQQCSSVRYCSLECATQSWTLYHAFECKYLNHIYKAGKYGHLALRTLLKAGLDHCKELEHESYKGAVGASNELKTFNSTGIYDPTQYTTIYNLVGHTDLRAVGDIFRRTVIAVYLLKCIEPEFFQGSSVEASGGCISDSLLTAGGIILRHLQSFPCNAHEISELQLSYKSVETSVTMEIGAGIYATMSLFNHSCEPNVTRFFYGDKCVVRALTSITAGQEIADNYGVLSALTPRSERQNRLASQYYFECHCEACDKDAPLFADIADIKNPTLRCEFCGFALPASEEKHINCLKCNVDQNISFKMELLEKSDQRFKEAVNKLFQGDVVNSLPQIQGHLRILEKNVVPPWKGFNSCKELIKQCYNMMANCHVVD